MHETVSNKQIENQANKNNQPFPLKPNNLKSPNGYLSKEDSSLLLVNIVVQSKKEGFSALRADLGVTDRNEQIGKV